MREEEKDEIARQVADKVTNKIIYTVVAVVIVLFLLKMCGAILVGVGDIIFKEVNKTKSSEIFEETAEKKYFNRGFVHYQGKDYKKALTDFNLAISIDPYLGCGGPDSNCIYYWRGLAYEGLGKLEEASLDFKKACNFGDEKACDKLRVNQ